MSCNNNVCVKLHFYLVSKKIYVFQNVESQLFPTFDLNKERVLPETSIFNYFLIWNWHIYIVVCDILDFFAYICSLLFRVFYV